MTEIGLNIKQQFVNPASNDKKEENVQETEQETAQVAEIPAGNAPVANDQEVTSQDAAKALAAYIKIGSSQDSEEMEPIAEKSLPAYLSKPTNKLPNIKTDQNEIVGANKQVNDALKNFLGAMSADVNKDGKINLADYKIIANNFGKVGNKLVADIDGNGVVDQNDVKIFEQYNQKSVSEYVEAFNKALEEAVTETIEEQRIYQETLQKRAEEFNFQFTDTE